MKIPDAALEGSFGDELRDESEGLRHRRKGERKRCEGYMTVGWGGSPGIGKRVRLVCAARKRASCLENRKRGVGGRGKVKGKLSLQSGGTEGSPVVLLPERLTPR